MEEADKLPRQMNRRAFNFFLTLSVTMLLEQYGLGDRIASPISPARPAAVLAIRTNSTNPTESTVLAPGKMAALQQQSTDPSYVLKPKDTIQVVIFQEDDMNTITRISPQGRYPFR